MYITILSQTKLENENPESDVVVLALLLYSDATLLSGDGKKSGWPLVMSLANIPLSIRRDFGGFKLCGVLPLIKSKRTPEEKTLVFQVCLKTALAPLKVLSNEGIEYRGFKLFPLLFAYIHDYPEGCKVNTEI